MTFAPVAQLMRRLQVARVIQQVPVQLTLVDLVDVTMWSSVSCLRGIWRPQRAQVKPPGGRGCWERHSALA